MAMKQADWERQMDAADQKQAKLMHFHWNLIRDQIGTLVRELAGMRQEVTALQMSNTKSVSRHADHERQVQQLQIEVEREAAARQRDDEIINTATRQLKVQMDEEGLARGAKIDDAMRSAKSALEATQSEKVDRDRALQTLEAQLQASLRSVSASVDAERDQRFVQAEVAEQSIRTLQLSVENEARDRLAGDQEFSKSVRDLASLLDQAKSDRSNLELQAKSDRSNLELLSAGISVMQSELAAEREQRGNASEQFERRLAEGLRLEKSARQFEIAPLAEALDSSERRIREEMGRAIGDQQVNADRQLVAERSARDEVRSSLIAQIQITEADLRRELSNVENDGSISQAEVRKTLMEHRDAVDRELKNELGRVSNEQHAETARLRDSYGVLRLQLEQTERKARDEAAQFSARLESLDRALRGELSQLGLDVQGATNTVRGEYNAFLDQMEASSGSLRKELELVASRCEASSTKLRQEHGSLRESLAALQQKVNDGSSLHDRLRSAESSLQVSLESTRAELAKVVEEQRASLVSFRASVDRQHSELNERFLRERTCRESGDGDATGEVQRLERLVRDELAQQGVARASLQQEVTTIFATYRTQLESEKVQRKCEQSVINDRLLALAELSTPGDGAKRQVPESVGKAEFEAEARRIWDALDSHTHSMPEQADVVKEIAQPALPLPVETMRPQQTLVEIMRPQMFAPKSQPLSQDFRSSQQKPLSVQACPASGPVAPARMTSSLNLRQPSSSPVRSFSLSASTAGLQPMTSISIAPRSTGT